MCSVGDDNVENDAVKFMENKLTITDKTCNKCKKADSSVLLRGKDCYCKECFLNGTLHKFKAFLGKQRLSRLSDNFLVSFKTGHPCTALLQFLRSGADAPSPKRMRFAPTFVYVEHNYHLEKQERLSLLKNIKQHVEMFDFVIYFVSLSEYIIRNTIELVKNVDELKLDEENKIIKLMDKKIKLTYKKEFYDLKEQNALVESAKLLNCSFVITTDISSDLAVNLLTNVSLGRGNQLPLDIGICDDRDDSVKIIKPMRSLNMKECTLYNYYNKIEPVTSKEVKEKPYSSVQSLMRNFVHKLQVDYPATITTVVRTGEKLSVGDGNAPKCETCGAPVFVNVDFDSSEATEFSRHVSTTKIDVETPPVERYDKTESTFKRQGESNVCYACKVLSNYLIK